MQAAMNVTFEVRSDIMIQQAVDATRMLERMMAEKHPGKTWHAKVSAPDVSRDMYQIEAFLHDG
jgi:hypothetical protein